ncbi:hypothetical protein BCR41DRAFT_398615, partial [Lobosporangium transversale]
MPSQTRPSPAASSSNIQAANPHPPVTGVPCEQPNATIATLVFRDGTSYQGISFGAETKSIAGECVFQT